MLFVAKPIVYNDGNNIMILIPNQSSLSEGDKLFKISNLSFEVFL